VTVPDLKPNPQETTAFYLENIYQLLADANISLSSIPITPVKPPEFSPQNYVILVNSLWSLSLVIGLTCAMLATLVQQWGRRYLRITQGPQFPPHDRARIRTFLARGVKNLHFSGVVEAISALINVSLFLFFVGFLIYLFNINRTVFNVVVWWIMASAAVYLVIAFLPILRLDSPYYAPLSSLIFWISAGISYHVSLIPDRYVWLRDKVSTVSRFSVVKYLGRFSQSVETMAEESIRQVSPEIDNLILQWTFDAVALAPDAQLDQFFKSIIGVYTSKRIVQDPKGSLATLGSPRFSSALVAFLNRTLSSVSENTSDKIQRFIMCMNVADATHTRAFWSLLDIFRSNRDLLRTVGVGSLLRRWERTDKEIDLCAQIMIADIIANVQDRDNLWIALAADQLEKSKEVIQEYFVQDNNSVSLANWIYITRKIFRSRSGLNRRFAIIMARDILLSTGFDIRNALPALQHDFCALWNEIIEAAARSGANSTPGLILEDIRHLYIHLHPGPDDAPENFRGFGLYPYLLCNNPDHRLHSPPVFPPVTHAAL
jgi:Family of unknown function (DUF6535)